MLADEPTAALDQDSTRNVVRLFKELTVEDGTAILMVTHDHRIIELADRLVHMVDGRIVSDVMLNDALRICEFLKGVEAVQDADPDRADACRRAHDEAPLPARRCRDPRGRHRARAVPDLGRRASRSSAPGSEVARLGPGDFFGELALLSGNPRNATVVATDPLETYVLGEDDFRAAIRQQRKLPRPAAPGVFPAALTDPSETRRPRPNCNPVFGNLPCPVAAIADVNPPHSS